jgi:hypothetical protein
MFLIDALAYGPVWPLLTTHHDADPLAHQDHLLGIVGSGRIESGTGYAEGGGDRDRLNEAAFILGPVLDGEVVLGSWQFEHGYSLARERIANIVYASEQL